ncbi:hypothetical protein [Nocardiopsis lambiniae]|uniref:Uncharacterized protein n=1 Tax=Nocardiopsis lambiniae TaxID=3075539 RepID=A0ABU2M3L9_9ACTN|nr:hypothetical protein [Nocardiopsis sp. DSM 44743]MDT0326906.1 hypothetical protein [Nocardiopsis sp. DSM 44743]
MDGRTDVGNGRRLRPSAVLGDLITAVVPPLLPAALATAAAGAALSAGAATGTAVSPTLPALAVIAFVAGAPISVNAALSVTAAALLGRRADPDGVRRGALRAAPVTLAWLTVLAVPVAAVVLAPAPWVVLSAAVPLLPLLPALLSAVPIAVVTGGAVRRVLPETLTPRRFRALLVGLPSRIRVPEHTDTSPSITAPVPVALLLGTMAVSGVAWSTGISAPVDTDDRTTVHIEAADGSEHLFEVDLAAPDGDARTTARVGDHLVNAHWRTGPAEEGSTLYLRVCPTSDSCGKRTATTSGGLDVTTDGAGSFEVTAQDRGAEVTLITCADPGCTRAVPAADPPSSVTVEVDGPDSMRLVLLSCGDAACPDTAPGDGPERDPEEVPKLALPATTDAIARPGPPAIGPDGIAPCAVPDCASDV